MKKVKKEKSYSGLFFITDNMNPKKLKNTKGQRRKLKTSELESEKYVEREVNTGSCDNWNTLAHDFQI